MSPLDDELRSLLHSRAGAVTPSPDPLAGIERRATRLRRDRAVASVVGTALAVAAIALAVPSLVPDNDRSGDDRTRFASSAPSAEPSPAARGAFDPQQPWAYRGDTALIAAHELSSLQDEWATRHPGSTLTPLFGHVYEPSAKPEIAFSATGDSSDRLGVATSSDAGWTFEADQTLAPGSTALMVPLPGDEVPRLLVLAAPTTGQISYAADGETFRDIQLKDVAQLDGSPATPVETTVPGVGVTPLQGDTSRDAVRVLDGDGDLDHPVFLGPAPDYAAATPSPSPEPTQPPEVSSAPTLAARYALDPAHPWAYRGAAKDGTGDIVSADRKAFVMAYGDTAGQQDTPLYTAHLSATTDVAAVLHVRPDGHWVSFTVHDGAGTRQVAYQPAKGEDIVSAYLPLTDKNGLLVAVASDQAGNLVLQTGSRAEVGGSRTAGIWDWTPTADPQARLAAFATGDIEPYSSQPAT